MKKKLLSIILTTAMIASVLTGCSLFKSPEPEPVSSGKIGVAMPTKFIQRWNQDGSNLQELLESEGYEVDLRYASNDVATQVSQIEGMINDECQILVIAPVDTSALGKVMDMAKEKHIPVIAYDRLIMDSDAVSYYVSFDSLLIGRMMGEYIRDQLDLDNAAGPFNIEIVAGAAADANARYLYDGSMEVLQPYIDAGKLVVKSGQVDFEEVTTVYWSTEVAQARMDEILAANYADGTGLDAVLCASDAVALGVENSLEANYTGDWPVITGQDCAIDNVKNMIAGKQSMSVFKDTRELASKAVEVIDAIKKESDVPVNDTESYNNGKGVIPSLFCDPVMADATNYKGILIDSGYYTESDLQ